MPRHSYRRPSRQVTGATTRTNRRGVQNLRKNYAYSGTGGRKHEFTTPASRGDPTVWTSELLVGFQLAAFARTFTAADDTPPTATAGNNYQSSSIMNGSTVENFSAVLRLNNNSGSTGAYIDVYTMSLSFYEALVWETIQPATALVDFDYGNSIVV